MDTTNLTPIQPHRLLPHSHPSWNHRGLPGGGLVYDTTTDGTVEIHLAGEIDVHDRPALRDVLTATALESSARLVHVFADDVSFVDLRILRVLSDVRSRLRCDGRELIVTGLQGVYATAWTYVTANAPSGAAHKTRPFDTELPAVPIELRNGVEVDAHTEVEALVPA